MGNFGFYCLVQHSKIKKCIEQGGRKVITVVPFLLNLKKLNKYIFDLAKIIRKTQIIEEMLRITYNILVS